MKKFVFTKNSWCLKCLIVGWGMEDGGGGINTIWISVIECHKEADGLQSARQLLSNEKQLPKDNLSLRENMHCYIVSNISTEAVMKMTG